MNLRALWFEGEGTDRAMLDLISCSWRNDLSKFGSILSSSTCSMTDEIGQILASVFPRSLEPLLITCLLFASSNLFLHWWDEDFASQDTTPLLKLVSFHLWFRYLWYLIPTLVSVLTCVLFQCDSIVCLHLDISPSRTGIVIHFFILYTIYLNHPWY